MKKANGLNHSPNEFLKVGLQAILTSHPHKLATLPPLFASLVN